jgi:hypothetical protein
MAGATGVGSVLVVDLLEPSTTLMTSSNGRPATRLGYAGAARWGLQRSDSELGRRLGFQYLRIKIRHRTCTIYRAFLPNRRQQRSARCGGVSNGATPS